MQENNNAKPKQTAQFKKKNNKKGGGCFICGSDKHWASVFPDRKYKQEKKSANVVISETGGGTSGYGNCRCFGPGGPQPTSKSELRALNPGW